MGVTFRGDFETGDFSQWPSVQNVFHNDPGPEYDGTGTYYSAYIAPGHIGLRSARFEVRNGDIPFGSSERSEVGGPLHASAGNTGDEKWFQWSIKFDQQYPTTHSVSSWAVVSQFHNESLTGSPPIDWAGDLTGQRQGLRITPQTSPGVLNGFPRILWTTPYDKGNWHTIRLHIKFHTDPTIGFVELWWDGIRQTFTGGPNIGSNRTYIQTLVPGGGGTYFKQGYYRQATNIGTGVIYHAGFVAATEESDLGPLPGDLSNMQYEIAGLRFGRDTDYLVERVQFGQPAFAGNDAPLPREDGIRFGRDRLHGRTILFDLVMNKRGASESQNSDALGDLYEAWSGDSIRTLPDEVIPLRMNRFGRITRVYGRPRNFLPAMGRVGVGWVPVTADFQCSDHLFYEDEEQNMSITIVPASTGGFVFPLQFPASSAGIGEEAGEVVIGGNRSTWITTTITGPIVNPEVDVLGHWKAKLLTTILSGQSVTIDPRPWSRGILLNGVTNVAGALTSDSPKMGEMVVPPGNQQIVLRGTDVTGTAHMSVKWRNAYRSP
jgi:hypothetical protein